MGVLKMLDNYDANLLLDNPNMGETLGEIMLLDDVNDLRLLFYSATKNGCRKEIIRQIEERMKVIEDAEKNMAKIQRTEENVF